MMTNSDAQKFFYSTQISRSEKGRKNNFCFSKYVEWKLLIIEVEKKPLCG